MDGVLRPMPLSEIFYDYLESPIDAEKAIRERPPMALAFCGFLAAATALSLWENLGAGGFFSFTFRAASIFLWSLLSAFLWAAVIHLYASMRPQSGAFAPTAAKSLVVYFGLSDFAWALAAVAAFVSLISNPLHYLSFLLIAIAIFLNLALKARGIKSVYQFSGPKSWLLALAPYVLIAFFGVCFIILGLLGFFLR